MEHAGMSASHIVHLKIAHMVATTMLGITHTGYGKITDTTTIQHYFDCHTQTVISKTFTTDDQPGKVIGIVTPTHVSNPTMSFMHITIVKITDNCHKMVSLQLSRAFH